MHSWKRLLNFSQTFSMTLLVTMPYLGRWGRGGGLIAGNGLNATDKKTHLQFSAL